MANWLDPPPAGSTATTMWLVLWRLWKVMMSTGISSRRRFMNFSTFSEGKAFWVLSAETPMLSRKLRRSRLLERLLV